MVAGDNLLGFDLAPIARAFRASGRPTLCLRRVVRDGGPSAYNEVRLAAIALYLFPARVAVEVERYLAEGGNPDAPGHFIAWLVDRTACQGVVFDGAWRDVGSLEGLERARAEW